MGDLDRGGVIAEHAGSTRTTPLPTSTSRPPPRRVRGAGMSSRRNAARCRPPQPRTRGRTSSTGRLRWTAGSGGRITASTSRGVRQRRGARDGGTGPEPQRVADQMSESLLAFARSGNSNTRGIPAWLMYGLERRQTMVFNLRSAVVDDPRGDERRMFEKVPDVQPGTNRTAAIEFAFAACLLPAASGLLSGPSRRPQRRPRASRCSRR